MSYARRHSTNVCPGNRVPVHLELGLEKPRGRVGLKLALFDVLLNEEGGDPLGDPHRELSVVCLEVLTVNDSETVLLFTRGSEMLDVLAHLGYDVLHQLCFALARVQIKLIDDSFETCAAEDLRGDSVEPLAQT